ncbi:MAG: hypothetical protein HKN26_09230 [Acidimicrobiales bacterium]|nr:hypothetical protein [Acidimicrobiales bacterium]
MNGFRLPALLLVPALLVGAVVYDERERPRPIAVTAVIEPGLAVANRASAAGTTWYCAAASLQADDTVSLVNLTQEPRTGLVTAYPVVADSRLAPGAPAVESITLGPGERRDVVPVNLVDREVPVSLVAEFGGGGVLVEHQSIDPELGAADRRPCITSGADGWFFPAGATADDAEMTLVVFNPFPETAVADITFFTDAGGRNPRAYEALVIPGRSSRLLRVDEEVADRVQASTFLRARSGRLVVERALLLDGTAGRQGLSVSAGASRPSQVAYFPVASASADRTTAIVVANPSEEIAEIDIEFFVGPDRAVEPVERRIRPGQSVQLTFGPDTEDGRILEGVTDYSLIVRSQNGIPIVAERFDVVVGAEDGLSSTIGSPLAATVWAIDVGLADPSRSTFSVLNPLAETIVQATVTRLDGTVVAELELPSSGRAVVDLGDYLNGPGTLLLDASSPVVVERELVGFSSRSTALAVPLADTIAVVE